MERKEPEGMNGLCVRAFLDVSGMLTRGEFVRDGGAWRTFKLGRSLVGPGEPYLAPGLPIDFHCHGVGDYDFSMLRTEDLPKIQEHLRRAGRRCVLTLYPERNRLDQLRTFAQCWAEKQRELENIVGVALEGPLLNSTGGIPVEAKWDPPPTRDEWEQIAALGAMGLRYVVLSPNAPSPLPVEDVFKLLLDHGISPAFGHFGKHLENEARIARSIEALLGILQTRRPRDPKVVTDHLFNDMPVPFAYAFRRDGGDQRARRELADHLSGMGRNNLETKAGPILAMLLNAALNDLLVVCVNFDGIHVAHEACNWVVDLLGARRIIAMTDMASPTMLGRHLKLEKGVWWSERDGQRMVAAGNQTIDQQIENLRGLGLDEGSTWQMASLVPARVLGIPTELDEQDPMDCSYFSADRTRTPVYAARACSPAAVEQSAKIAAIAVDLDGTLLDSMHQLSDRAEQALKRAMARGVQLIVATGKTRAAARDLIDRLGLDTPGIYVQGLVTHNADGSIRHQIELAPDVAHRVIQLGQAKGFSLAAFSGTDILVEMLDRHVRRFVDFHEPEPIAVGPLHDLIGKRVINKLVAVDEVQNIPRLRRELEELTGTDARITESVEGMVEVLPKGTSKGLAFSRLLNEMTVPREQVLAIGDSESDQELLEAAGVAVAVHNAAPELKRIAHYVVASNDDDGVAEALERFVLK